MLKTITIFPKDYCPLVADIFPPDKDYVASGITWTFEDTLRMHELEEQAEEVEVEVAEVVEFGKTVERPVNPIVGRYYALQTKAEVLDERRKWNEQQGWSKPAVDYSI